MWSVIPKYASYDVPATYFVLVVYIEHLDMNVRVLKNEDNKMLTSHLPFHEECVNINV